MSTEDVIKLLEEIQRKCMESLVYPLKSGIKNKGAAGIIQDYINDLKSKR